MRCLSCALAIVSASYLGCSSGSNAPISPPSFSPTDAAKKAMSQFDANGDGRLDLKELDACPSLRSALAQIDADRNGKIGEEELVARLELIKSVNVGLTSFMATVTLDGSPLEGATVTLTPEPFLGPAFKPAKGTTGPDGMVGFTEDGRDTKGVQCGYFRVQVTRPDDTGKDAIPAKFNSATVLGVEIFPSGRGDPPVWALLSR